MNYVDPVELLVVDRTKAELRGLGHHESAISILESLGSVDSVDAYQVITHRKVLVVEGGSDRRVLRAIAAKRNSQVFEGNDRLVVIEAGGESTVTARSDLSVLERMMGGVRVNSLQVVDRDARLDEYVDAYEERASRPTHVWRRDAIESYLVLPSVIARLVCQHKPELDAVATTTDIDAIVEEVLESLRDETFDRVATRFRHDTIARDSRNVEPVEANQAARAALEDAETRLRLTHGKRLLAGVRKSVQETFGVSLGTQALIAEANLEEFDPELLALMDEIEELTRG